MNNHKVTLLCPECNSVNLVKYGKRWKKNDDTQKRELLQQYQCKDCGRITHKPETSNQ